MSANDYGGFSWRKPECGRHFKLMPKSFVATENEGGLYPSTWSGMSKSSQALLPVILRHTDTNGICFPGEGRLAALAGLTRKTVRSAARELENVGVLTISRIVSRSGRCKKVYRCITADSGFILPSIFIDGGNWSQLIPSAKSLAISFRLFSKPRPDLDPDCGERLDYDEMQEYLFYREYDYCNAEPMILRAFAGIRPRVYKRAIQSLQANSFIEPDSVYPDWWRVFVSPPRIMMVEYLNSCLS